MTNNYQKGGIATDDAPILSTTLLGRKLEVSATKASNSQASLLVSFGKTTALVAANIGNRSEANFAPLTVNCILKPYVDRRFAILAKDGALSEAEVLMSRSIDRAIRPLFPKFFCSECVVNIMPISYEIVGDEATVGSLGAVMSLIIAGVKLEDVAVAIRLNDVSKNHAMEKPASDDVIIASLTEDKILMIEGGLREKSPADIVSLLSEKVKEFEKIWPQIKESTKQLKRNEIEDDNHSAMKKLIANVEKNFVSSKSTDSSAVKKWCSEGKKICLSAAESISDISSDQVSHCANVAYHEVKQLITRKLLIAGIRKDERAANEPRKIDVSFQVIPESLGSCIVLRGNTSILAVSMPSEKQNIRMPHHAKPNYQASVHYRMLPFTSSTADHIKTRPVRREIGHGAFIRKSLQSVVRIGLRSRASVEVLSADGATAISGAMAAVIALAQSGERISKPICGLSIGIIRPKDNKNDLLKFIDLTADEDSVCDVDCKIARTNDGITAIQMDSKHPVISIDDFSDALMQIYESMEDTLILMQGKINEAAEIGAKQQSTLPIPTYSGSRHDENRDSSSGPRINDMFTTEITELRKDGALVNLGEGNSGLIPFHLFSHNMIGAIKIGSTVTAKITEATSENFFILSEKHARNDWKVGTKKSTGRRFGSGNRSDKSFQSQRPRRGRRVLSATEQSPNDSFSAERKPQFDSRRPPRRPGRGAQGDRHNSFSGGERIGHRGRSSSGDQKDDGDLKFF